MDQQNFNIPDILLKGTPDRLKVICLIRITKAIIGVELADNYDCHNVLQHHRRDDINIDKLDVSCPVNRFDECTKWGKFHISCYVSRAFQMLCDKLSKVECASDEEIERMSEIVENRFKIRLLSVIDQVNTL